MTENLTNKKCKYIYHIYKAFQTIYIKFQFVSNLLPLIFLHLLAPFIQIFKMRCNLDYICINVILNQITKMKHAVVLIPKIIFKMQILIHQCVI